MSNQQGDSLTSKDETVELDDSQTSRHDCHSVVKSSGLNAKKRLCCEHGHKCLKILKASVACQTDPNENDLDMKGDLEKIDQETGNSAFETSAVIGDSCHVKDEDAMKSEGILRLMIHNFRNMNDTVRGPPKLVSGVPWKIMVMPRQHVVAKKGTQKCLGFFLQCCPESYSDSWSCQAAAELRLISQKPGVPNFVRKTNHIYTAKENDWGYSCFMTWADILDESQGYMKEESVILEVSVKAELPKGILTYEAFCKKIQDYMRLSDMQCSRNLIDKALEVNQTALKFCKDKDEVMKEELEKQKNRLIERKVMQSIERIEKDSKLMDNFESGTNLNNLRQALAGNLAAYKSCSSTKSLTAQANSNSNNNSSPPTPQSKEKCSKPANNNENANSKSTNSNNQPLNNIKSQAGGGSGGNSKNENFDTMSLTDSSDQKYQDICSNKDTNDSSSQREVKTIVENLVSSLSTNNNDSSTIGFNNALAEPGTPHGHSFPLRRRSTGGHGAIDLFDLDEACCSDQSDDDDDESDYEDIDEVCDGCLVEKLDNMSGTLPAPVDAQDMWCQTDFNTTPVAVQQQIGQQQQSRVRLTPVGAVAPPSSPMPAALLPSNNKNVNNNSNQTGISPPNNKSKEQQHQNAQGGKVAAQCMDEKTRSAMLDHVAQVQARFGIGGTGGEKTTQNENDKVLKRFTEESKASINSIKDTLERLLAQDTPTNDNIATAPLPFDLNQLQLTQSNVKTDIIDISCTTTTTGPVVTTNTTTLATTNVHPPSSVAQKTIQQQQQLLDVSQQMVQIKQIVEFKRHHHSQQIYQQLTAAAVTDEEALQRQQQFVQTDLPYVPRAPSPITEEDYTLLRHAKEIVENKAEELVSRYSQLIEQSEANRLAETVKKVEKRMKDIEKQTMTCRKELSDECERHYREEQKLIKANKQLKQQLDQSNEKIEKLNLQLKERRAEIKKMEKKLKAECQTSAENAELNSKIEQLERDLSNARHKHSEEKQKFIEENQKLVEAKKSLQQELSCATSEIERLHAQMEDRNNHIRKSEALSKQERQQTQASLKEASERAKKAEINLLEFKLEIFSKTLQRSYDECKSHVSQLEELSKKVGREQPMDDFKWLNTYVQDWQKVKERIHDTLQKMKADFAQQIDMVKSGKTLASLPVLDLPKPIPFPQTPKQLHALIHEPKQPIAPIGVHPTSANMKQRSFSPCSMATPAAGQTSVPPPRPGMAAPITPVPVGNGVVNNTGSTPNAAQQSAMAAFQTREERTAAPTAETSSAIVSSDSNPYSQQQQQQQHTQPNHVIAQPLTHSGINFITSGAGQQRNDFTPWSDPLQGLTQSLFGNKSLAGFDGFGVGHVPSTYHQPPLASLQQQQQGAPPSSIPPPVPQANKNAPSAQFQQPPPLVNMTPMMPPGSTPQQWNSWPYHHHQPQQHVFGPGGPRNYAQHHTGAPPGGDQLIGGSVANGPESLGVSVAGGSPFIPGPPSSVALNAQQQPPPPQLDDKFMWANRFEMN